MRTTVTTFLGALALSATLAVGSVALASGDGGHGEPAHASAGGQEGGGHATEEGGHGGEHHPSYSGDADHDGTANWLDSDSDDYVANALAFHAFNFLIYAGIIWFGAGAMLRDGARARAIGIKADINEASELRADAKKRHDAVIERLAALEGEIASMHAQAEAEARAEEAAIRERAEATARRIAETTERQIRDEAVRARGELRREAVELAVKLAEGILLKEVQPTDQRRLAQQFLDSIQQDGGSHV